MKTNILELLNKVWRSNYEHALYFEEQNKEDLADTFFDNAKLLEKITEELKKQSEVKTKYIVYPTYYYDNSKMEKLEYSFLFDDRKSAEEFLSLCKEKYTTLTDVDYFLDGWFWGMKEILTDNSTERLNKLAKEERMIKEEVELERELDLIEEIFDFFLIDFDRGGDYDQDFIEYVKKDIDAGYWDDYIKREIWQKYDILEIIRYIYYENDGKMIKKEELEKYRKNKEE